jgi:hypothetical protein
MASSRKVIDHTDNSNTAEHLKYHISFSRSRQTTAETYCDSPVHGRCRHVCKSREHRYDDGICCVEDAVSVKWYTKYTQRPSGRRQWFANESSPQYASYTQTVSCVCSSIEKAEDAIEGCWASKIEEGRELEAGVSLL